MNFRSFSTISKLSLLSACGLFACTLALKREHDQCATSADCQDFGPEYLCSTDKVCVTYAVDDRRVDSDADDQCSTNAQCAESLGPSLCRDGRCLPLNDRAIGCVSLEWGTTSPPDGAEVMPIGMLVPEEEIASGARRVVSGAVGTAINELNRARDEFELEALPPLVGIACNEASDEALEYLVGALGVTAVIGPTSASRVERVLSQAGDQAVIFLPSADGPNLELATDEARGFVVGCKPNRAGVQPYFLDAVSEVIARVGTASDSEVVPVLAVSEDVPTTRFAAGINDLDLADAGVRRLDYTSEAGGRGLVSALKTQNPPPNLVIAASGEDVWSENLAAVDRASFGEHGFYPYYLLMEKRFAFLSALLERTTASGYPRQYQRLLGLDYHKSERSRQAYDEFQVAFQLDPGGGAGGEPDPGLEYAYDCTYAAAYAAVAAERRRITEGLPSAEALAVSLDALTAGETQIPVRALSIPDAIERLIETRGEQASLDLIGTSGDLDFEAGVPETSKRQYFRPKPPDGELYCIGQSGVKGFCDTGVVFPADGGPPSSDNGKCDCLGSP